jgi:hypothetical protein
MAAEKASMFATFFTRRTVIRSVTAVMVFAGALMHARSSDATRWKLGPDGCYLHENDAGPDQCQARSWTLQANRWFIRLGDA